MLHVPRRNPAWGASFPPSLAILHPLTSQRFRSADYLSCFITRRTDNSFWGSRAIWQTRRTRIGYRPSPSSTRRSSVPNRTKMINPRAVPPKPLPGRSPSLIRTSVIKHWRCSHCYCDTVRCRIKAVSTIQKKGSLFPCSLRTSQADNQEINRAHCDDAGSPSLLLASWITRLTRAGC